MLRRRSPPGKIGVFDFDQWNKKLQPKKQRQWHNVRGSFVALELTDLGHEWVSGL